jgi:hypothetical protein
MVSLPDCDSDAVSLSVASSPPMPEPKPPMARGMFALRGCLWCATFYKSSLTCRERPQQASNLGLQQAVSAPFGFLRRPSDQVQINR